MTLILPLLSIFGFASIFANIFKTRFTFSLPIVTSILVATLFLSTALGILYYATFVIIVLGLAAQVYSLCAFPELRESISIYRSELIALAVIITSYFLFVETRYIYIWDDLAFWAVFSKELIIYGDLFPQDALSSVLPSHIHYMRGPSLFHYFMLYFGTSDGLLLTAHVILQMLFLAPLMANKYFWQTILLICLLFLLPAMHDSFALRSLYNDATIGFIFSSALMIFILEENKHKAVLLVIPILALMPLFREIGLVLAILGAIIILAGYFTDGENHRFSSLKAKLLLLSGLLILPLITYNLWFLYLEAHNVIIGRKAHSIASALRTISVLLNNSEFVDKAGTGTPMTSAYFKTIVKVLMTGSFLWIYAILIAAWLAICRYGNQYKNSFVTLLTASSICLLPFLLWRLYLFIHVSNVYMSYDITSTFTTLRYGTSYIIIFFAIACAYIKKILANQDDNSTSEIQTPALITITIGMFCFLCGYVILIPKQEGAKDPAVIIRSQAELVRNLISKGFNVEFDFSYDNTVPVAQQVAICYKIAYPLAPYYSHKLRHQCTDHVKPAEGYISGIERDKLNSNIEIENILQNPTKYKCKIKFYPMYNHIDMKCL